MGGGCDYYLSISEYICGSCLVASSSAMLAWFVQFLIWTMAQVWKCGASDKPNVQVYGLWSVSSQKAIRFESPPCEFRLPSSVLPNFELGWWCLHLFPISLLLSNLVATTCYNPPPLCLTKHVYHPNRSWDVLGHNSSNHESIWNLSTYRESVQCHESLCSQQSGWMLSPKLISNWIRLILLWRYLFGFILIIPLGFLGEGWEIFETTNQPRYPSRISKASKRMRNQSR